MRNYFNDSDVSTLSSLYILCCYFFVILCVLTQSSRTARRRSLFNRVWRRTHNISVDPSSGRCRVSIWSLSLCFCFSLFAHTSSSATLLRSPRFDEHEIHHCKFAFYWKFRTSCNNKLKSHTCTHPPTSSRNPSLRLFKLEKSSFVDVDAATPDVTQEANLKKSNAKKWSR